jgi:CheY-like chemotaxis protein
MTSPILIIEDNEQNLYLMRFLLETSGFTVADARDGREGIRKAAEIEPAVILLDIQLPFMDGYAVAAELRKHGSLAGTPIIAVTSYAMPGDRERVLAAGATAYVEKPINPDTFVDEIRRHMAR